jgi:23S rRNA (guanosine2251-2'-O)-methyltransferase
MLFRWGILFYYNRHNQQNTKTPSIKMTETLIYGHHPVAEAIRSGKAIEKVYFQQGLRGEMEKEFRHLAKEFDVPLAVVPKEKLDKMIRGNHQGVAAYLALVEYKELDDVLAEVFEKGEIPLVLLLDSITDVRNFGAICRSAELTGVHAIVLPTTGAAAVNEEAMKASAGALARVTLCREKSLFNAIDNLKASGIQLVCTALTDKSVPVYEVDLTIPTAIIMGAEGTGVHPKMLKMSEKVAKIPQVTDFDSYNVSVAAGIMLYEAMRQRILAI